MSMVARSIRQHLPFVPDPLAASFSCLRNCSDGLPQSLSMDSDFFQQPDGRRSHKSSASHFNWPDFCIPATLSCVCCQLCVPQFLTLVSLFNRVFPRDCELYDVGGQVGSSPYH